MTLAKLRPSPSSQFLAREWNYPGVLKTGLGFWCIGFAFMLAYDTTASVFYIPKYVLGLPTGVASNLRLMAPLGAMMLIYLLARRYRQRLVITLLVTMMAAEFIFGFIVSSKELSFRLAVLLLLGLYYLRGRASFKLLVIMLLVSIPYLLYFNAYRLALMEGHFLNSGAALSVFDDSMKSVKRRTGKEEDVTASSMNALRSRIDGKIYVEIITSGTESGKVPYLYGKSINLFFGSWIPRVFWPEKPDISYGQEFNRAFHLSNSRYTFVPMTMLGELYWNFAMPGVILGMFLMGMILRGVATSVSNGRSITLPRFLVLLLVTYFLAIRFEGNIANQFSTVMRLVALVWIIDRIYRALGISHRVQTKPAESPRVSLPVRQGDSVLNPWGRPAVQDLMPA